MRLYHYGTIKGKTMNFKFVTPIILIVSACGGGGGGGVSETVTTATVTTNTTGATLSNGAVTSMAPVNTGSSTAKVTRNAASEITKLEFTNPLGTTTLDTAAGDTIVEIVLNEGRLVSAYNADASKQIFYLQDSNLAVGTWYNVQGSTGYSSVGHAGTTTSVDPATLVASATYNGILFGTLSENGFSPANTIADLQAIANFNTKSITVTSSGTYAIDQSGNNLGAYAGQNFVATISDPNGDNIYTGGVTDSEGKSGSITANLYGSSAQSLAGVGTTANVGNTRVHQFSFVGDR